MISVRKSGGRRSSAGNRIEHGRKNRRGGLACLTVRAPVQVSLVIGLGAQFFLPDWTATARTPLTFTPINPKVWITTTPATVCSAARLLRCRRNAYPERGVRVFSNIHGPAPGPVSGPGRTADDLPVA